MEKEFKYKRIIILGGGGSGKSTLANRIGEFTGYPVYHLDNLLLNYDWSIKNKNEWEEISNQFLSKNVGVVDGNYSNSIPNRINWADLIIYIDIPTRIQLYRIIRRHIRNKFGLDKRHGFPEGSKILISMKFILWTYHWNSNHKNKFLSMLESAEDKKVLIIKESRKLDLEKLLK
jgi:adenylate kinase family enzyme